MLLYCITVLLVPTCTVSKIPIPALLCLQGEVLGLDPRDVNVPVVGGHAGVTILPLLSQVVVTFSCCKF